LAHSHAIASLVPRTRVATSGRDVHQDIGAGVREIYSSVASTTLTMPTQVVANPLHATGNDIADISHVVLWALTAIDVDVASAVDGYAGEGAIDRMIRVSTEAAIPFSSAGSTGGQALGPQPVANALAILRDAEHVDLGVLYEADFGLACQAKSGRYNAPVALTLDFNSGHIAEPPEPADDDQRTRNRFAASRTDGSYAVVEDADSIAGEGLYDDSDTFNTATDDQLLNMAGWKIHAG
jgi:hypothetical protein